MASTCIVRGGVYNTMDASGVVTLIFYRVSSKLWEEPFLNIVAALAQGSRFTHCELSIGTDHEHGMKNVRALFDSDSSYHTDGLLCLQVLRVFNDDKGCELCARTGRSPHLVYVQLGCSAEQERRMLHFARQQIGKPFSQTAMFRSLIMPRKTTGDSYFCAELVADCLKFGGMLDQSSNPGAATPTNLYSLFSSRAAVTANPYMLRQSDMSRKITTHSVVDTRPPTWMMQSSNGYAPVHSNSSTGLKVLNAGTAPRNAAGDLGLTLNSLIVRR